MGLYVIWDPSPPAHLRRFIRRHAPYIITLFCLICVFILVLQILTLTYCSMYTTSDDDEDDERLTSGQRACRHIRGQIGGQICATQITREKRAEIIRRSDDDVRLEVWVRLSKTSRWGKPGKGNERRLRSLNSTLNKEMRGEKNIGLRYGKSKDASKSQTSSKNVARGRTANFVDPALSKALEESLRNCTTSMSSGTASQNNENRENKDKNDNNQNNDNNDHNDNRDNSENRLHCLSSQLDLLASEYFIEVSPRMENFLGKITTTHGMEVISSKENQIGRQDSPSMSNEDESSRPVTRCYRDGTDDVILTSTGSLSCQCKKGWAGEHCSEPPSMTYSDYPREYGLDLCQRSRRIVYAFPFSHEFDLLEKRLVEHGDVVDLFVVVESNYTAAGRPKKMRLRDMLARWSHTSQSENTSGTSQIFKYRSKILIAELTSFPDEAYEDGWVADELLRTHAVTGGMSRLRGVADDDIFVMTDADEIPSREALLFLKLHYGYPEPIGFRLRHHVFSEKWLSPHSPISTVFGACTFSMLRRVFASNPYYLRRAPRHLADNQGLVADNRYLWRGRVAEWSFGSLGEILSSAVHEEGLEKLDFTAGVHCSWCFDPAGIVTKMTSAQVSDVPRWADVVGDVTVEYITALVERGVWFDNETLLIPNEIVTTSGHQLTRL